MLTVSPEKEIKSYKSARLIVPLTTSLPTNFLKRRSSREASSRYKATACLD